MKGYLLSSNKSLACSNCGGFGTVVDILGFGGFICVMCKGTGRREKIAKDALELAEEEGRLLALSIDPVAIRADERRKVYESAQELSTEYEFVFGTSTEILTMEDLAAICGMDGEDGS